LSIDKIGIIRLKSGKRAYFYALYQIQTINTQTLYDNKLTTATYDAIRAFQINTTSSTTYVSLEYPVKANVDFIEFLKAETDASKSLLLELVKSDGTIKSNTNDASSQYGVKPYISYSCRYKKGDIDVVITFHLLHSCMVNIYKIHHKVCKLMQVYIYLMYLLNILLKQMLASSQYGVKPYISYSCRYKKGDIDVVITYALDNHSVSIFIPLYVIEASSYVLLSSQVIPSIKYPSLLTYSFIMV